MKHLLPPYVDGTLRYQRLDFQIPSEISQMDDASEKNINNLVKVADKFVKENVKRLDEICEIIMK